MTQDEVIELAKQSGFYVKDNEAYSPSIQEDHELTEHLGRFSKLVLQHYRKATLDTIDALFDSEDPNPMYQIAYNHALIHMQEFIISMEKNHG